MQIKRFIKNKVLKIVVRILKINFQELFDFLMFLELDLCLLLNHKLQVYGDYCLQ
jgi:hypothetical protein